MTAKGDKLIATMLKAEAQLDKEFEKKANAIFELLDPFELDETYGPFEAAFLDLLETTSGKFLNLQKGFLRAYVFTEFGIKDVAETKVVSTFSPQDRKRYSGSLSAVTTASIKTHSANGHSINKAYADAKTRAIAAGRRSARDASREHMGRVSMRTKGIKGYKRVATGSETCSFCRMLTSRGAVYAYDTVGFKAHDDCDCIGVPTVDGPAPSPDQKYVATPKSKPGFDKEKAAAAVKEWERKRDAGELAPSQLPPISYYNR